MPLFELLQTSSSLEQWDAFAARNAMITMAIAFALVMLLASRYLGSVLPLRRVFASAESALGSFASRSLPLLALLCFVWGFGIAALLWFGVRRPVAHIHDEASYLLAADTFAHGRWTNPALPSDIAAHFEALHIIVSPSYMSKYPPGQGLLLASGIVLGHNPAIGLWINAGLICTAALYMLLAFVPRRWALLGALLTALHPAVLKWTQSFWGGNLSLLASLLLVGAIGRIAFARRKTGPNPLRARDAVVLAIALAIFANTRPFEGLVAAIVSAVPLLGAFWRDRARIGQWALRVVLPAAAVLAVTAGMMLVYNIKVTGKPLRMPYAVHEDTYGVVPLFLFQKIKPIPPTLRHDTMRFVNAYTCVYGYWGERDSAINLWRGATDKVDMLARSAFQLFDPSVYWLDTPPKANPITDPLRFVPAFLLVPGLLLAFKRRDRITQYAVLGMTAFVLIALLGTFMNPHYGAPVGALALLVWMQSWRHTRILFRSANRKAHYHRTGLTLARLLVPTYLASAVFCTVAFASPQWEWLIQDRRPVLRALNPIPGNHLVLVYYGPLNVRSSSEWVYNGSDLAHQKIVWARYLTDSENADLLRHFPGRQVWLLNVEQRGNSRLYRYDAQHMAGLPFPTPRVADPAIVEKVRRGLPTRPKGTPSTSIAALPPGELRAYHEGVAKRSATHRRFRGIPELPLVEDSTESGNPEY